MIIPENIRKVFRIIESHRYSKSFFWKTCVLAKDILWRIYYYLIDSIFRIFRKRQYFKSYQEVETYHKISFCITSMDRLCHIRKTLIKNIKNNISYPNLEFILLDYNSQDGLEEWVHKNCQLYLEKGILKYHRIEGPTKFHMAHAKNLAHSLASGDVVCGLDADNYTNRDFAFYINFEFIKDTNLIGHCSGKMSDFGGRMFLSKINFERLGGYDEEFLGWGYEDLDFKHRAFADGLTPLTISDHFLICIKHGDHMRHKNMSLTAEEAMRRNETLFLQKNQLVGKRY